MIAASGKWLGNSEAAQPAIGGVTAGTAGILLGVSATTTEHGSFADAMQQSAEFVQPTVDGVTPGGAAVKVGAGVATTRTTGTATQGSFVADAVQTSATAAAAKGVRVPAEAVQDGVGIGVAGTKGGVGGTPVAVALRIGNTKMHGELAVDRSTGALAEKLAGEVRQKTSSQAKEDVTSTEDTPQKDVALATMAASAPGRDAVGRNGAKTSDRGAAVAAKGAVPPAADGLLEEVATGDAGKTKSRSETRGKVQAGKEQRENASGSKGSGKVVDVGTGGAGANAVSAAPGNVEKTSVAVLASGVAAAMGDRAGKEKLMHPAGAAVAKDGKDLVPGGGAVTSAESGAGTSGVVDAKNSVAEKVVAGTTEASVTSASATASAMAPVAVVAQGHALNVSPGVNVVTTSHVAAGAGLAASAHGVEANEMKVTTIEAAKPNQLEVGLRGGEFGWLKVRAELGANGEVNAFLRGASSTTTEALQVAAPKIAAYLGTNDVAVRAVHVESLQGNGGGAGVGGDAGSGSAPRQQTFGGGQKSLGNAATNEEGVAGVEGGNEVVVPVSLMSGRSVVSLTGTGNWLSVRA